MQDAPFVLIDDSLSADATALLFEDPVEIVSCDDPGKADSALARIAAAGARGLHAAGFLSYELGYLLEPRLRPLLPDARTQKLIWMGLFRAPKRLDRRALAEFLASAAGGRGHAIGPVVPALARNRYLDAIRRVRDYILAGDVYQINFTFPLELTVAGDPVSLYAELRRRQPVAHGALIRGPGWHVLSLSPELFFEAADGRAATRPMKGTARRGATPAEDAALARWLASDEKSRAENLMIVDLLRNDLSRVSLPGSVKVPALFTVETYPTVLQMTSTVESRLMPGIGIEETIRALFPCGSVTGAPKVRAMEIIRELEDTPRGVYTGAIGHVAPDGAARFNVAIRTLYVAADGAARMGIGSGIVHESGPEAEWEECLLKARFLTDAATPFDLIETLRWSPDEGFVLLDRHMNRLAASARYFGRACDPAAVRAALQGGVAGLSGMQRVRLLLDAGGRVSVAATPIAPPDPEAGLRYALAETPVDSTDPHRRHKTTRRQVLDEERARLAALVGCDEVIFANERGELTEGSYTTLFVERGGRLLTPPLSCGLLDGTLRRELLEQPASRAVEQVLYAGDLANADAVWLGNSVRGLLRARPVDGALSPARRRREGGAADRR